MKVSHLSQIFLLLGWGLFLMGAVAKKQDPILLTQTNPVAYEEKKKEEADGKKGPPAPSMEFFPRRRFLTDPPILQDTELDAEEIEDEFKLDFETDDTWETTKDRKRRVS